MTDVRPGGNRRIDRVLAEDYLDGVETLPLDAVRAKLREVEQEEVDLSYLRRLLHGRIDIVRAEQARRSGAGDGAVVEELPTILADGAAGQPRGNRALSRVRHLVAEPTRVDRRRRRVERLVADVDLSDVAARTDDELARVLRTYEEEERLVSEVRTGVHHVLDRCAAELTRRYASGEASVADLLAAEKDGTDDAAEHPGNRA